MLAASLSDFVARIRSALELLKLQGEVFQPFREVAWKALKSLRAQALQEITDHLETSLKATGYTGPPVVGFDDAWLGGWNPLWAEEIPPLEKVEAAVLCMMDRLNLLSLSLWRSYRAAGLLAPEQALALERREQTLRT